MRSILLRSGLLAGALVVALLIAELSVRGPESVLYLAKAHL